MDADQVRPTGKTFQIKVTLYVVDCSSLIIIFANRTRIPLSKIQ